MPHSTNAYIFERKVFDSLSQLAWRLTGKSEKEAGFFAELGDDGALLRIYPESIYPDFRDKMEKRIGPALLYDPFDFPYSAYIEWKKTSTEALERLLGIEFTGDDFDNINGDASELKKCPESHSVMF